MLLEEGLVAGFSLVTSVLLFLEPSQSVVLVLSALIERVIPMAC